MSHPSPSSFGLYPVPRILQLKPGTRPVGNPAWTFDASISPRVARWAQEGLPSTHHNQGAEGYRLHLAGETPDLPAQGYHIHFGSDEMQLSASDEAGYFYGLQTLFQVLDESSPVLPEGTIEDYPDFAQRGFMLDISRCKVPTMESLKELVRLMARLKLNQLQLYTEHTFAFKHHKTVWEDASPMTPDEIRELDEYCTDHFITLVPNLNSFGHFERWLRHDAYRHLAECPDGFTYPWGGQQAFGSVLKPDETSLAFLDELYAEMLPNFSSSLFNIGCDETWELGQGGSKPLCDAKGKTRVYLEFLKDLDRLVKKYGRKAQFWGDIILHQPELIAELPAELTALAWGYEADHPFAEQLPSFANSGVPFYVCPGTSSWRSLIGRTGNALANLQRAAAEGLKNGAEGFLMTDWGDLGHLQYWPISCPGLLAGAGAAWAASAQEQMDLADVINRLILHDPHEKAGQLLLEMGRLHETVVMPFSNSSVFFHLLLLSRHDTDKLKQLDPRQLQECEKQLSAIREEAAGLSLPGAEGARHRSELVNGLDMALLGVHRGQALVCGDDACGSKLKREMEQLLEPHRELWLERNRPGGLAESVGYLTGEFN